MKKSNLFVVITCVLFAFASCSSPSSSSSNSGSGSNGGGSSVFSGELITSLTKEQMLAKLPKDTVNDEFAGNTYESQQIVDGLTETDTYIFGTDGTLQQVSIVKGSGVEMMATGYCYYNVSMYYGELAVTGCFYKVTYSFKGISQYEANKYVEVCKDLLINDYPMKIIPCEIVDGNLVVGMGTSKIVYTKK